MMQHDIYLSETNIKINRTKTEIGVTCTRVLNRYDIFRAHAHIYMAALSLKFL